MRLVLAPFAVTLIALLAACAPAVAGPIEWSYHTAVTYSQDYGSRFLVTLEPDGTASTMPGDQSTVWLFRSTGVPRPEPGSFATEYEFTVAITITDLASGQSGTMDVGGWYESQWMYQPEDRDNPDRWRWDFEISGFGDFWGGRGMVLGENHYTARAYGGSSGSFPFGELTVEIHPMATTPEPGTRARRIGTGCTGTGRRLRNANDRASPA